MTGWSAAPWGRGKAERTPLWTHIHSPWATLSRAASSPPPSTHLTGGVVDPKAVYTGPLTLDVEGKPHEVRWQQASDLQRDRVQPFPGMSLGYAATWLYVPQACELEGELPRHARSAGQHAGSG